MGRVKIDGLQACPTWGKRTEIPTSRNISRRNSKVFWAFAVVQIPGRERESGEAPEEAVCNGFQRPVLARAGSSRLWGLLWGLWVQIGITRYLSMSVVGLEKTPAPQGFGA